MPALPASPPGSPTKGKSLKVRAIIKYGAKTTTLTIPCGDGKKTVRWLGVVAAQRFVLDGAARGRVRNRERGHAPGAAQVLPRNVSTPTEAFAHPDALVKDVVRDGGDVIIELDANVALDAKNAPKRSNWQVVAFKRNDERGRAVALADEYAKREASKAVASMKVEMIAAAAEDEKGSRMRELIHPQLLDTQHLGLAVEKVWGEMDRNGLMKKWIRQPRDQERVKRCLANHYLQLCELFKYYGASVGSVDQHLVEFPEFSAFARDAGVYGGPKAPLDHALLAECFAEACEQPVTHVNEAHMALPQFLAGVVWLAEVCKHVGRSHHHQRAELEAMAEKANRERSLIARRAVGGAGVGEKLERFLADEVEACVHKRATQLIGLVAKQHLGEQRVLARFWERHVDLRRVFATYLGMTPDDAKARDAATPLLSFANFQLLVEDSGLLEATGPRDELTRREVRRAFAGARHEIDHEASHPLSPKKPPGGARQRAPAAAEQPADRRSRASSASKSSRGGGSRGGGSRSGERKARQKEEPDESELLSYAEFCEAVLRLAMLKWASEGHALDDSVTKVRDVIAMICDRCQGGR